MQLRFLLITGPNSPPASVDFGPGLNVIYGGSNTGKSHVLRLIDFVLGAKNAPEPIVEQAGYDLVHVGVVLDDGAERTLVRALQGGNIKILDGLVRARPTQTQGTTVSAQHSAQNSLSRMLLTQVGAKDARIRTDASGKTRDLSFRDLERHALISETKIQDVSSPVLSGQFVTKTAETSVFKYMLTGVDDSALDVAKPDSVQPMRQAAQLELLDRQIRDTEREIAEADQDHEELLELDSQLDAELSRHFVVQESAEVSYRELTSNRLEMRKEYEAIQDRLGEIDTLTARFDLLAEHYRSDEARLASIVEAGQFFTLEDPVNCPVCGAAPEHHRPEQACDGDVTEITAAAEAEITQLKERAVELQVTINGLKTERDVLAARARALLPRLEGLQADILREVPTVQTIRSQTSQVIARKLSIQKSLELVRRRDALVTQRVELGVSPGYDSSTIVAQQQLDGATLDAFSQMVEAELQTWDFPDAKRVFFELPKMDIAVAGKSRAANGKGVRALLHGAFDVGLMKFCKGRGLAHPGFLILDSLFITYKDPSDDGDSAIASTPLKDRAFRAFSTLPSDLQLIILENVDVPDWLAGQPQVTHFTGSTTTGRAGLFPK
ncbi:hypothetical protein [Sphingomonas sp.]|uniref:hypothetical protein n=1 Tax=Sphingomonas sp. TaxID=28214 RepID=UPI002FC79939